MSDLAPRPLLYTSKYIEIGAKIDSLYISVSRSLLILRLKKEGHGKSAALLNYLNLLNQPPQVVIQPFYQRPYFAIISCLLRPSISYFLPTLIKASRALFEMFHLMTGRNLSSDPCLPIRYNREEESYCIYSILKQVA